MLYEFPLHDCDRMKLLSGFNILRSRETDALLVANDKFMMLADLYI